MKSEHSFNQWSLILAIILLPATACLAATIHVPGDYPTIQEAINAASDDDTVMVADGVYTGVGNTNLSFENRTITLASANGSEACIIDCQTNGRAVNRTDETGEVLIQGFTIRNGDGNGDRGGGIYNHESLLRLNDCTFEQCSGLEGGGLYLFTNRDDIVPEVFHCRFQDNSAELNGGGAYIFAPNGAYTVVDQCAFEGNTCPQEGSALWVRNVHLTNSAISNNVSFPLSNSLESFGSSVIVGSGTVDSCRFDHNALTALYVMMPFETALITRNEFLHNGYAIGINNVQRYQNMYWLYDVVIGGSPDMGNSFTDNCYPAIRTDTFQSAPFPIIAQAQYNIFNDYPGSRYICETEDVNLENGTYLSKPLLSNVYVSPNGSDSNPGVSPEKPFRTLTKASRSIQGTPAKPLTILLAPGVYDLTETTDSIDHLNLYCVSIQGMGQDKTILDGGATKPGIGGYCAKTTIADLTVRNAVLPAMHLYGPSAILQYCTVSGNLKGGASVQTDSSRIEHCIFENNQGIEPTMGGLYGLSVAMTMNNHPVTINDCVIRNNSCGGLVVAGCGDTTIWNTIIDNNNNEHPSEAAGLCCRSGTGINLINCLISNNYSTNNVGGIRITDNYLRSTIINCTFVNNTSDSGPGTGFIEDTIIQNSVFNGNSTASGIHLAMRRKSDQVTQIGIASSNIQGGPSGIDVDSNSEPYFFFDTTNFDEDSLFVTGPKGDFYLSQTASGQGQDSPCLDRGTQDASAICIDWFPFMCMSETTTRTDEVLDSGIVDVGYHYMPTEPDLGMHEATLMLAKQFYQPGDAFRLDLHTRSSDLEVADVNLFIALEVAGELWFYPEWRYFGPPEYPVGFEPISIRNEVRNIIPDFAWPDIDSRAEGIHFICLCMNPGMTEIVTDIDMIEWGFGF